MKKRIGWLNNKPIIQGDKNLKNSNELHIDELSSSNSQGGSSDKIEYFKFKEPNGQVNDELFGRLMSTVAYENDNEKGIISYGAFGKGMYYNNIFGFSFTEIILCQNNKCRSIKSLKEFFLVLDNGLEDTTNPDDIPDSGYDSLGIQPITKEEYYNLIK